MRYAVCVSIILLTGCSAGVDHPEIRAVLDRQIEAWNRGDLEGFMAQYWKSDELVFCSPKSETHGWQATMARYKKVYPTREKMGSLSFDVGEIARTGVGTAELAGRFRLDYPDGCRNGRFYLHLRRIDGTWVIVRDYTVQD